jgi:hypothetical protein
MRSVLVILLLLFIGMSVGCSFSTDFVVVNASSQPVQVTYTIAPTTIDLLAATGVGTPAILPVSELREREWRVLASSQYTLDRLNRTVSVSVLPNQGLLINRGGEWHPNSEMPNGFIIQKIQVVGMKGAMSVEGDEVYKSFAVVPKPFYSFGPPTLLTLTYK